MFLGLVKKGFSLLFRAIGVFSFLALLFFIIKYVYYDILFPCFPNVFSIISQSDYNNLPVSLIAINFTLMGFAITLRNILLGRYSSQYSGFSMKAIIECSTTKYCRACWYLVVSIPFFSIVLYFFGFRRQLYFYTMLSGLCMIVYFLTVLGRLRNKVMSNTIAYIIAEEVFNRNERYDKEYRKELIGKLCGSEKMFYRSQIIISETLNVLYTIIHVKKCSFLKKRFFWFRTIIQEKIKKKMRKIDKDKNYQYFEKSICGFSMYSFDYFSQLFLNSSNEESVYLAYYCDLIDAFTSEKKIMIYTLKDYFLFESSLNNDSKSSRKTDAEYTYMLVINMILGLFCACASNCCLETIIEVHKRVAEICENNEVFIGKDTINALMLFSVYYLAANNLLYKEICIDQMISFCTCLFESTSYYDFVFIRDFLDKDFIINDKSDSVRNVLDRIITERQNNKCTINTYLINLN